MLTSVSVDNSVRYCGSYTTNNNYYNTFCYCLSITVIIKTKLESVSLSCKSTALKQQISKFYSQILSTEASYHIYTSDWPATNVKASVNTNHAVSATVCLRDVDAESQTHDKNDANNDVISLELGWLPNDGTCRGW